MRRRKTWSGAAVAAALVLATLSPVGLAPASADEPVGGLISTPGMAVSLDQAGEARLWGDNSVGQLDMPAELNGVAIKQVVLPQDAGIALTAAGRVVGWGANTNQLQKIPAVVTQAKVVQIAATDVYALAITDEGKVLAWGKTRAFETPLNVPEGLSDVKQVALSGLSAAALKNDGTVVAWGGAGDPSLETKDIPEGLVASNIVGTTGACFVALTTVGTLEEWGRDCNLYSWYSGSPLEGTSTRPTDLKSVAANMNTLVATLPNGKIVFADNTSQAQRDTMPSAFGTKAPILLANGTGDFEMAIVDDERNIHYWNLLAIPGEVPADLNGKDITQIVLGNYAGNIGAIPSQNRGAVVIRKLLRVEPPQVAGLPAVGSTLTATPGTFSASPDSVTGQWLAGGEPIAGATGTSLLITTAMAGKALSYQSTASKTGQTTISSSSAAKTVPSAATVQITAGAGAYGKASVVTVTVAGATGNVALTVDGKSVGTKALASGKAAFSVPGTTAPGKRALKATYAGGETFSPGSANAFLTVGKGKTGAVGLKVAKASPKRAGTVSVTIATSAGLVKASGVAQLVLKQGKTTKKVNLKVVNGKVVGKLPKLKKGTWSGVVTYRGSTHYLAAKSKSIKFKSK